MEAALQSFALFVQEHITAFAIYQGLWTIVGCWIAARQNQKIWFAVIAISNTLGLIEIIYLATQTDTFKNWNFLKEKSLQIIIMVLIAFYLAIELDSLVDKLDISFLKDIETYLMANPIMLVVVMTYQLLWRMLGTWFAARSSEKTWFAVMSLSSTFGLIEIIYLATQTRFFKNFNLND